MSISLCEIAIIDSMVLALFVISIYKQKLTFQGELSALVIGICVSFAGYEYFIILLSFFASSIKATDLHKEIKQKLLGETYNKEKKRTAIQVLSKGFFPTLISLIIAYQYKGQLLLYINSPCDNLKFLYGAYIGFYVSANADTWASELGIASSSQPILISTLQRVPKGINGAISLFGTIMSILGGLFVALFAAIISMIRSFNQIEFFAVCPIAFKVIAIGIFCGFIGSLIDSILGSTFQISLYDIRKKCIIEERESNLKEEIKNGNIKVYGRDILNNSQVNLIAGIMTSIISGCLYLLFL